MKYLAAVVVVVALVGGLVAAKQVGVGPFQSGLRITLRAPKGLRQTSASGWTMRRGAWIKSNRVQFSVRPPRHDKKVRLEVELASNGAAPSGIPAPAQNLSANSVAVSGLSDGPYRWWARWSKGKAVSPWVGYSTSTGFGVNNQPPSKLTITSSTNPSHSKPYRSGKVAFDLSGGRSVSGAEGYWYELSSNGATASRPHVVTHSSKVSLSGIGTGRYVFHARVRDRAGKWSPDSRYELNIDSTPPTVTAAGFSTFNFNPSYGSMTFNYAVSLPASIRIGVYRQRDDHLVRLVTARSKTRGQILHYTWRGRNDHDQIVSPGGYKFVVRTTDRYGLSSVKEYSGLTIINERIVVSLSQQRLWAYNGHHLLLTSLVTTGNKALPTPTGTFSIMAKYHPFTFVSPFPKGSWDYYAPSPVQYAMLFRAGGYYIHDAPWRSVFGPGSNAATGAPGQNYTGTHGCVNVPSNVAYRLFNWTVDGTPVIVVR